MNQISSLKEKKEKLEEKLTRHKLLLDNIETQVWCLKNKETYGSVNRAYAEFVGVKKEDVENKSVYQFRNKKEAEVCIKSNEQVFKSKNQIKTEEWVKNKEGEERLLAITKTPKFNDDGQVSYVVCKAEDITERKLIEKELRKINRVLVTISEANKSLIRASNEQELMDRICEIIVNRGYSLAWIGIALDNKEKEVKPIAQAGYGDDYLENLKVTWSNTEKGQGPTGKAIRTGKISVINNMYQANDYYPWRESATKQGYQSSIAIPLKDGDKVFGALNIYAESFNAFDEIEKVLFKELASDLSYGLMALRNKAGKRKAEKELRENKVKIEKLHEIACQIGTCYQEEEVYQLTIKAAEEILAFNLCIINIKEDDKLLIQATSSNINDVVCRELSLQEGIPGKTFRTKESYLINNVQQEDVAIIDQRAKYKSSVSVPIGEFGVFQVIAKEIGAFEQEDLKMAELLISHTTAALNRIQSEEEIRYMTFHDSLTGLYNRTYFKEELERYDTKRQLPLSIILGDVNGLKLTNDAFGHQVGDELLIKVAQILEDSCRKEDLVARWGGDEFIVLLPQTKAENIKMICNRIKTNCNQTKVRNINPSIALGYATKNSFDQEITKVFQAAEDLMYKNKLNESKSAHNSIIKSLKKTLREKTYETSEHAQRLKEISLKFSAKLSLSDSQVTDLSLLAELHDLGKVGIANKILEKTDSLNRVEYEEIKRHPEIGYQIAKSSAELNSISEGILSHHEWWDGSGYPQGLKGEEIPLIARIIAIVDAYDVMVTGRPYKDAISKEGALNELRKQAGSQFDPTLVKKFVSLLTKIE